MLKNNLRMARKNKGFIQDDVADFLNVKRQTYSAYERGVSTPDIITLGKLADLFDVNIDYLLTGNENNSTIKKENKKMKRRLIDFLTVKKGLTAYFYGEKRYCYREHDYQDNVIKNNETIDVLSQKTGISFERINEFIEIAFDKFVEVVMMQEDKFPESVEFDKMMFVDFCEKESAILLQKRLNEEYEILQKEKNLNEILNKESPTAEQLDEAGKVVGADGYVKQDPRVSTSGSENQENK